MNRRKQTEKTKHAKQVPIVRLENIPRFRSEAEEAAWWDAHPEVITKAFELAYGKAGRRATRPITIRLPVEDVARAKRMATRKGLGYQTLVKTLLHEALLREDRA